MLRRQQRAQKICRAAIETLESRMMLAVTPPTNLTAVPTLNSGGVVLNWQDNAADNWGYIVERSA